MPKATTWKYVMDLNKLSINNERIVSAVFIYMRDMIRMRVKRDGQNIYHNRKIKKNEWAQIRGFVHGLIEANYGLDEEEI